MAGDPNQQVFWLASRAVGIVALALLAISVSVGLAMAGGLARRPGLPGKLKRFHEAAMLVTLALIAGHAGLLLFDGYLRPGPAGITLPFALGYRPAFTGTGVIAGWLAVILGLSFYVRKWIGAKTWRRLHRFTIVVYLLALGHVIGAGTDATSVWMLALLTVLTAPVVFGFAYRVLPAAPRNRPNPATTSRAMKPGAPQARAVPQQPWRTSHHGPTDHRPLIRSSTVGPVGWDTIDAGHPLECTALDMSFTEVSQAVRPAKPRKPGAPGARGAVR